MTIVDIIPRKTIRIIDIRNYKKRYMNIKLKAILTVLIFFSTMIGMTWGLTKIPSIWIINGFIVLIAIGCMIIAYYMALGYYRDVEELKKLNEQDKRKIEYKSSRRK